MAKEKVKKTIYPRRDRIIYNILHPLSFIFLFISYWEIIQMWRIDNMLHGKIFLFLFLPIGGIIGYFLAIGLEKRIPIIKFKSKRNIISKVVFLFFLVGIPSGLAIINNKFYYNRHYIKSIIKEKNITARGSGWHENFSIKYISVIINNKEEDIVVDNYTWNEMNIGDKVQIEIASGCIGFNFVKSIKHE